MIVSKSLAFDITGNLPRLLQEEVEDISVNNVMVRENNDGIGLVRLSQLIPIVENLTGNYEDALNEVLDSHDLEHGIIIADETSYFINPSYRQAVHEASQQCVLHLSSSGYDKDIEAGLLEMIDYCLDNDTVEPFDTLLEGVQDQMAVHINQADTLGDYIANIPVRARDKIIDKVGNYVMGKLKQGANYMLEKDPEAQKIVDKAANIGNRAGEAMVNAGANQVKKRLNPYVKGAMIGTGAVAVLGALAYPFVKMTDQDTIRNASPHDSSRIINTLNKIKNHIEGKQMMYPPQQQGIIARIIAKIKAVIYALGRKIGLVK